MRGVLRILAVASSAASLGTLLGCTADFLPASFITNARVIAVTAEPPEATPGAQVTVTPTVVDPSGQLAAGAGFTATWWRCPDSDSDALGDYDQCTVPSTRKDIATGVPYVDTVPADIFGPLPAPGATNQNDALPSDKLFGAILGYWRIVGLTMQAGGGDNARVVDGFKRIPVYLPGHLADVDPRLGALDSHVDDNGKDLPPNANPTLSAVLIHQDKATGPTTTKLQRNKSYFFAPVYDERALEPYISLKVDLTGLDFTDPESIQKIPVDDLIQRFQKVQRCEIPTFSWFVTAGKLERDSTLDEGVLKRVYDPRGVDCPPIEGDPRLPEVQYTPPTGATDGEQDQLPKDGVVHGFVVMRDGRGGTAVRAFDFTVE